MKGDSSKKFQNDLLNSFNDLKNSKSVQTLEKIYAILKEAKVDIFNESIIPNQISKDLLLFLTNNLIDTKIQSDIFKLYIESFFSLSENLKKINNTDNFMILEKILEPKALIYEKSIETRDYNTLIKRYFDKYFPKEEMKYEPGKIVDALIYGLYLNKIKIYSWNQLTIKKFENDIVYLCYDESDKEEKEIEIKELHFIREKNTFAKEEEMLWRKSLKIGDKVDTLDNKLNWIPAKVMNIIDNKVVLIPIGSNKEDTVIEELYSPLIRPYATFSLKFESNEEQYIPLIEKNSTFTPFSFCLPVPIYEEGKDVNYLIPDGKTFSLLYFDVFNYFLNSLMKSKILDKKSEEYSFDFISMISIFISKGFWFVHHSFNNFLYNEKLFPLLKDSLIKVSLDKKKNLETKIISKLFEIIFYGLEHKYYEFRQIKIILELNLNFGLNCFNESENLQKRLIGLNTIYSGLNKYYNFFVNGGRIDEYNDMIHNLLLNEKNNQKNIFELIFNNKFSIHEQLVLKGKDIFLKLFKLYILNNNDINKILNIFISSEEETDAYKQIYLILEQIIIDFPPSQVKEIIHKITKTPIKQIKKKDVDLLFHAVRSFKNGDDYKEDINIALDYVYNLILADINNSEKLYKKFVETIYDLNTDNLILYFLNEYIEKIFNDLLEKNDKKEIIFLFHFMKYLIIHYFKEEIKEKMIPNIIEIMTKNNNNKKLIEKIFNDSDKSPIQNTSKEKFLYLMEIFNILTAILPFLKNNIFLDIDTIIRYFEFFLYTYEKPSDQVNFINNIMTLQSENLIDFKELAEKYFKKLDEFLSYINKENISFYFNLFNSGLISLTYQIYIEVNDIIDYENNEYGYINEECFVKKNPMDFKYFDVLFKLFTKSYKKDYIKNFLNFFSLRLFSQEERYNIWQKIIKKIFEIKDDFIDDMAILHMVNTIIEQSEKYGTAGVISHINEKIMKYPLKVNILTEYLKNFNQEIPEKIEINSDIYTTSTIYDLKKQIQKKLSIDPIFITVLSSDSSFSSPVKNHETLYSLFKLEKHLENLDKDQLHKELNKVYTVKIRMSDIFQKMSKYNLMDKENPEEFNNKAIKVFSNIFNIITNNIGKMDCYLYIDFIRKYNIKPKENEETLNNRFISFDKEEKGYLTFEEFLKIFLEDTKKENYDVYRLINQFGYSNELEPILQPINELSILYYIENDKSELMPRYFIGKNPDYMNKIFEIGTKSDNLREESNKLINELSSMFNVKDIISNENLKDKSIDDLMLNKNIEMKTYIFDIILSEFKKNNEINNKDMNNAIDLFIEKNITKLIDNLDDYTNQMKEEINVSTIPQYEKDLYYSKYCDYYNIIIQLILFSLMRLINKPNFSLPIFDISLAKVQNKEKKLLDIISQLEINSKQNEILSKINYQKLMNIIISFLVAITKKTKNLDEETENTLNILLIIFILFEKNFLNNEEEKNVVQNNYINNFPTICLIPVNDCRKLLEEYNTYIFYIKKHDKKFVSLIKDVIFKEIINIEKYNKLSFWNPNIFIFKIFELFITILITSEETLENKNIINEDNSDNFLIETIKNIINIITNSELQLFEGLIINYFKLLCLTISRLKELNNKSIYNFDFSNLLSNLINNFFINSINNNEKEFYTKYNNNNYISYLFDLINKIISVNPQKYIFEFFNQEKIRNLNSLYLTHLPEDKTNYAPNEEALTFHNYLGIKNLSSICYMNSVLQTLYMIPLFRKSILSLKIKEEEYKVNETKEDFDDMLFQLIRMFNYLTFSNKSYYNPKNFVYSFKDTSGKPTNPSIQCDAEEFLTRFVDKLEKALDNSPYKFLCHNILGGKTLQQIICTNPECNNISEKTDNIVYLSLDIKENKNLKECLNKYIIKEKIEDYHCEKCDQKRIHTKQVLIKNLPNILIIHLQRITFNYETFNMVKINDKVSFEKELNIKDYTFDSNNVKEINNQKYEYELIGIIVHTGTAQAGHYYSFIKSQNDHDKNIWYKFNDMTVTQTTLENIMGDLDYKQRTNYVPSPYMLIYNKKIKNPILLNIEEINNINIINSLKEDNNKIIDDDIKYEVYKDENEAVEKNKDFEKLNKKIILKNIKSFANIISYEEGLNYINKIYESFSNQNLLFKSIILQENMRFNNEKKIYTPSFGKFIKDLTIEIKKDIETNNNLSSNYEPIIKVINGYIFDIFKFSDYKQDLIEIMDNLCSIIKYMPKYLSSIIKEFIEPKKEFIYKEYLLSNNKGFGESISYYFGKILSLSININIENETSMNIINYYLDKIPVELSKDWIKMEYYNNFICVLIENSDKIKEIFLSNNIITKIIDFILGKESPLYKEGKDGRCDNKQNEGNLNKLVKSILLLYKYHLNKKDNNNMISLSKDDMDLLEYIPFYEKIANNMKGNEDSIIELISFKINSFNNKDYLNKSFLDFIIKIITPASKNLKGFELCLNVLEKIINALEEEKGKDLEINKIKILQIILGIPRFFKTEEEEETIHYLCGLDDSYYGILNNFSKKNSILLYEYICVLFKYILKHDYLYKFLSKNPAHNSLEYSFMDFLIKAFWEINSRIESNQDNEKSITKEEKEEAIKISEEVVKKYNINYESIINNEIIKPFAPFYFFYLNCIPIKEMKNIDKSVKEKLELYEPQLHFYYYRLFYCSEKLKNNYTMSLSHYITFSRQIHENQKYFCIEIISVRAENNCNLEISFEPYIYTTMKIKVKNEGNCHILIKKPDKTLSPKVDPKNYETNIDFGKFNFKFAEEENNFVGGNNGGGFVLNCPVCGTPNTITDNNQYLQCIACTSELL